MTGAQRILDACYGVLVLGSRLSEISTLNWSVRLPSRLERVVRIDDLGPAMQRAIAATGLSIVAIAIDPVPLPDRYARRLRQMAPAAHRHGPAYNQEGAQR